MACSGLIIRSAQVRVLPGPLRCDYDTGSSLTARVTERRREDMGVIRGVVLGRWVVGLGRCVVAPIPDTRRFARFCSGMVIGLRAVWRIPVDLDS